ncbi:hypothetical protein LCGC14_2015160, partial [marine sediment metagenome]
RPHMFVKELSLLVEHLKDELERFKLDLTTRTPKYFQEFRDGLLEGIEYYQGIAEEIIEETKARFIEDLERLKAEIEQMPSLKEVQDRVEATA